MKTLIILNILQVWKLIFCKSEQSAEVYASPPFYGLRVRENVDNDEQPQ